MILSQIACASGDGAACCVRGVLRAQNNPQGRSKRTRGGVYTLLRQSKYSIKVLTAMDALLRLLSAKQIER